MKQRCSLIAVVLVQCLDAQGKDQCLSRVDCLEHRQCIEGHCVSEDEISPADSGSSAGEPLPAPETTGESAQLASSASRPRPRWSGCEDGMHLFGDVDVTTDSSYSLELVNPSADEPVDISGIELDGPISFSGGQFPGARGSCATRLLPASSCTIEMVPSHDLGEFAGALTLQFADHSELSCSFAGRGTGHTENLIHDGDGEHLGLSPDAWTLNDTPWAFSSTLVHSGKGALVAGDGQQSHGAYVAEQTISIAQWSNIIATGRTTATFSGYAWLSTPAASTSGNSITIMYQGPDAAILSAYHHAGDHNAWTQFSDWRFVPNETSTVFVRLVCSSTSESSRCGVFDDLSLTLEYR